MPVAVTDLYIDGLLGKVGHFIGAIQAHFEIGMTVQERAQARKEKLGGERRGGAHGQQRDGAQAAYALGRVRDAVDLL